jgi:putrescine aminotransferase
MTATDLTVTVTDLVATYREHVGTGRAALASMLGAIVEVGSEGPWVFTEDGRRFLDFGGYGVFIHGHRHPRVIDAVRAQLDIHPLATRVFLEPVLGRAAQALAEVTPPGLDYVHFVNSGAEATEAALKLARANGRTKLISAHRGFHGKTIGALSITANPLYQEPFRPLIPDTVHVAYGDLDELRSAVASAPGRACVVLEPVQGEGGVIVPPLGYLRGAASICREHGAFLVIDEIQTGLGRLGSWWGVDFEGVRPDVLLVGKGLSGGVVPVAAMVATAQAYAPFGQDPYLHTSTFGGSPLACSAALAAIQTLHAENLVPRAARLGSRLLGELQARMPGWAGLIAQVRGRGLLIGLEFHRQNDVGQAVLELLDRGVLINHSLNASNVLRLTPPAVLTDAEIDLFLTVLDESLSAVLNPPS